MNATIETQAEISLRLTQEYAQRKAEEQAAAVVSDRVREAAPDLLAACRKAERFIDAMDALYGTGLEVANYHRNGNTEPFDNFIDDNSDGDELVTLRAAIILATVDPDAPSAPAIP